MSVEQQRLAAVRRYEILDTPPDGAFERVATVAARVFDVPMATVTIVDEDRIWFKAARGLPDGVAQIDRALGLCASAILQDKPYVLPDTLRDSLAMENSLVRGQLGIRFYAGAPITTDDGHHLGTVNVLDTRPREVTAEHTAILASLADVVMEQLELGLAALRAIRNQEDNLQAALASRTDTNRAVGMIMLARHCDADAAWDVLREQSQHANVRVRTIAETMGHIAAGADTTKLDRSTHHAALRALLPVHDHTA